MIYDEKLTASVQYDDYVGTAAADDSDNESIRKLLEAQKLIDPTHDVILAVRFWSGENFGGTSGKPSVQVLIANVEGYPDLPAMLADPARKPFRYVTPDLSNDEFFGCFKRFSIVLPVKGMRAEIGNNYQVEVSD